MKHVYKALTRTGDKLYSAMRYALKEHALEYSTDELTFPGFGKIFAYDTEENARRSSLGDELWLAYTVGRITRLKGEFPFGNYYTWEDNYTIHQAFWKGTLKTLKISSYNSNGLQLVAEYPGMILVPNLRLIKRIR